MSISKVTLDFAPGMHGHFLEYVLNRYIFQIGTTKSSIFQSSGACHPINLDPDYQIKKIVDLGHYSAFDYAYNSLVDQVVFIKHNPRFDFILLTNIYYRCHPDSVDADDFNVDEIRQLHNQSMFDTNVSDAQLRNNWYTKLMEHHFEHADKKNITDLPTFDFDFGSFFVLDEFLMELRKTANFLNHTFVFDESLVALWKEFIQRNQGYHAWTRGNYLFGQIVEGNNVALDADWKIHAYLNYKISNIFNLYDHPRLFGLEKYPKTTQEVFEIIIDHVDNFDKLY